MAKRVQAEADLWQRLTDLLNEMESAGISVGTGSEMGARTDWYSLPYLTSQRHGDICVQWSRTERRWINYIFPEDEK
ncbi:hypothetical protein [Streptomyces werraensis]|uniref:hypothetical protein n=1 Tax=Streptomyces werraensis TaxID=68284 RepID=UPI0036FC8785